MLTLAKLRNRLDNLVKITVKVNAVSEDVRQISRTVPRLEKSIRGLYEHVRKGLGPAAGANIAGVKAGTTTGVVTLVKSLKEGRRDDHEGRNWS